MKELADLLKKHGATLYADNVVYNIEDKPETCIHFGYKSFVQQGFYRVEEKHPLKLTQDKLSFTGFDAQMEVDQYNGVYL